MNTRKIRDANLVHAVNDAIKTSLNAVDEYQSKLNQGFGRAKDCVVQAKKALRPFKKELEIVDAAQDYLETIIKENSNIFSAQRKRLRSLNIVMFGRTGAGKSSLIEAITGGSGNTISSGECDHTTETRDILWNQCRFVDTPGIDGWGRVLSRVILEQRAKDAVQLADIVILVFDTTGQHEAEFAKISNWVAEFGRPVLAIVNVKNQMWRRYDQVNSQRKRIELSNHVRDHESHVRTQLDFWGITDVPIVALSTAPRNKGSQLN